MSIQYKPSPEIEKRYDREAEQIVKYLSGYDSKGNVDPFYIQGNEVYAESASLPTFKALDKKMAIDGEL
jgi:hypothetical protein